VRRASPGAWVAPALALGLLGAPARANLPASAITALTSQVYGMYTTSDATCQTGLVATLPLTATPTAVNFATAPTLGTGPIPSAGIACVVLVARGDLLLAWKAGTYTGTTKFGTSTYSDAACDGGGEERLMGCFGKTAGAAWPAKIAADLAALGLSTTTDCSAPGGPITALYLSTYSKCIGEVTADNAIGGGCEWSLNTNVTPEGYRSNDLSSPPTGPADPKHGIHIDPLPAGTKKYKLVVDPVPALGGNGTSSCGGIGPPRFSFAVSS
jgi:hypothetical protein